MGIPKTSDIKSTDIERHDNTLAAETLPEGRPSLGLQRSDKITPQIFNVLEESQIEVTQLNQTPDVFSLASTIPTASISSQVVCINLSLLCSRRTMLTSLKRCV